MEFAIGCVFGVGMFYGLKAIIAWGYRKADARQAAIDIEIDRLHK